MSFLEEVKRAWHGVGTLSSEELVKYKVRWCATSGDKVRHAHLGGFRVCDPRQLVSDPGFWLKGYPQPPKLLRHVPKGSKSAAARYCLRLALRKNPCQVFLVRV